MRRPDWCYSLPTLRMHLDSAYSRSVVSMKAIVDGKQAGQTSLMVLASSAKGAKRNAWQTLRRFGTAQIVQACLFVNAFRTKTKVEGFHDWAVTAHRL